VENSGLIWKTLVRNFVHYCVVMISNAVFENRTKSKMLLESINYDVIKLNQLVWGSNQKGSLHDEVVKHHLITLRGSRPSR
jgi:hypothetical protein